MKKLILLCTALLPLVLACASAPVEKQGRTDQEYYEKAMTLFNRRNYFDAIPAFEELREKFPLSPFAVLAELRLGDAHFHKDEFAQAVHYFENFRRLHPSNPHVPYSIYMTGLTHYAQILTVDRDQTSAREAVEQFQLLVDLYPTSPYAGKALCRISNAKASIAAHEMFVAKFYFKKGNYTGAADRYSTVLKYYPYSVQKDKALFYLAEALIQSEDVARGCGVLKLLLKRYPEGDYAPEAMALLELHASGTASGDTQQGRAGTEAAGS